MKSHLALMCGTLLEFSYAEPTRLLVPDQDWRLVFDVPAMTAVRETIHPEQYHYFGHSGRFNMTVHVEPPSCSGGDTHELFFRCYGSKVDGKLPMVDGSLQRSSHPRYYRLSYESKLLWRGQSVRQRHVNRLISYRGKWTDVHVSVIAPTEVDQRLLEQLERSLQYGELGGGLN